MSPTDSTSSTVTLAAGIKHTCKRTGAGRVASTPPVARQLSNLPHYNVIHEWQTLYPGELPGLKPLARAGAMMACHAS